MTYGSKPRSRFLVLFVSTVLGACSTGSFEGNAQKASPSPVASGNPGVGGTPATAPAVAPGVADASAAPKAPLSATVSSPGVSAVAVAPATGGISGTAVTPAPALPACGANGITQAKLLTTSVKNATAGNYLEYQVTVTDCQGNQIPFTASTLSFDLAADVSTEENLTYTITDAGNSANTVSGTLVDVNGHDLFGNTGSKYWHYETDKAVTFAAAANAIIVHITLGGLSMTPYDSPSASQMNTYLAFGSTTPIEETVTLEGAPASGLAAILGGL